MGLTDQTSTKDSSTKDSSNLAEEFSRFLSEHPKAHLLALGSSGVRVAVPDSIVVGVGHNLIIGRLVDLVDREDQAAIVIGWNTVQRDARTVSHARLAADPLSRIEIHWFDLRDHHGVVTAAVIPSEATGQRPIAGYSYDYRPRLGRMKKDNSALILEVDEATVQMFGFDRDVLVNQPALEFLHPDDHNRSIEGWLEMVGNPGQPFRNRLRHRTAEGDYRWVEVTNTSHLDATGGGWVDSELLDVSEEMAVQESLRQREELLSRLAEALPVGLLQLSGNGQIEFFNDRLTELTGAPDPMDLDDHLLNLSASSRLAVTRAVGDVLATGDPASFEVSFAQETGRRFCDVRVRALFDGEGFPNGAIVCVTDTTESAQLRNELEVRATIDALTGCLNRDAAIRELEHKLGDAGRGLLVSFIDLNRFKVVNDTYGHAAGDCALRALSAKLLNVVREHDVVGRIGGDEFIVITPGVLMENRAMIAERIEAAANCTITVDGATIEITATVGSTWTDDTTILAQDIIAAADAKMYDAKPTASRH